MKRRLNSWQPGWFGLVLCALILAGLRSEAASQSELNAWKAAGRSFNEKMWSRAEAEFSQFLKKYPASEYYADAVLGEAQARFQLAAENAMNQAGDRQWGYQDVVSLLASQRSHADDKADKFAYWTAEASYAGSNFTAAAAAYGEFANAFIQSDLRSEALFKEADARLQLHDTTQVIGLLRDPSGAFQQVAKSSPTDPWVARGLFLLAETELAGRDYAAAADALSEAPPQKQPELEWKRQYLLCRSRAEGGRPDEALKAGADLLAAADDNPVYKAESYQMLGDIYRGLQRFPEAIAAYQTNLGNDLPAEVQRRAALSIVELNLRQNQTDEAARRLADFLDQHPNETNSDFDLLALGELRLRQHFQAAADTSFLQQAATNLQRVDTNSEFWGKAQLNLGWCLWTEGKTNDSSVAFSNAVRRLPHGEDQAVALFKLGDALFLQTNYPGAIINYGRIIDEYTSLPSVTNSLFEPALYQILQAATAQTNLAVATNALRQLLAWFPDGLRAQPGMLLLGEAEDRAGRAPDAQKTFLDFIARWPQSPMKPDVDLAIAHTYELTNDWSNAISHLYAWVAANTNSPALPQAEFQLARADYKAGNDAKAFAEFTNFVARYPAAELAAQAQLWMGYYYFQHEEYEAAEVSFQGVFATNTPASRDLQNRARMMAGRSAFARGDFSRAIDDFSNLTKDSNCPPDLRLKAQFAWGDAEKSSATLASLSACQLAITIFADIATNHPDSPKAPLAWGRMGDCYLQLGTVNDTNQDWFGLAINAYSNVITSANADLAARCTAEYGVGQVLEKMAQSKPAGSKDREQLLWQAVGHYLNVVNGSNLHDNDERIPYLVQLAGMAAARIETDDLKKLDLALNLYQTLRDDLPPLQGFLDKKIANVRNQMANVPAPRNE